MTDTTVSAPSDVSSLLTMSDERDQQLTLRLADWREGFRLGRAAGLREGRELEAAEREEAWRRNAGVIAAQLDPDGPQARESAQRRVRAAEAGCRRDAWDHWHDFFQRAWATPPHKRTEQQRAAVALSRSWQQAGAA